MRSKLKLKPYKQHSLAQRLYEKLAPRFYGPFEVVERIGPVAYKLALPSTAKIHPVFQVSQLRRAVGQAEVQANIPPQVTADLEMDVQPAAVLGKRVTASGAIEILIQWENLPSSEATWEDFHARSARFPTFHLGDKVVLWEGGNAKTAQMTPRLLTYFRKKKRGAADNK